MGGRTAGGSPPFFLCALPISANGCQYDGHGAGMIAGPLPDSAALPLPD